MIEIPLTLTFFRFLDSWFAVSSTCTCGEEPTPPPCWRRHPWPLSYPGSPAPPAHTVHTGSSSSQKKYDWPREKQKKTETTEIDAVYGFGPGKTLYSGWSYSTESGSSPNWRTCMRLKQLGKVNKKALKSRSKSCSTVYTPSLCRVPA